MSLYLTCLCNLKISDDLLEIYEALACESNIFVLLKMTLTQKHLFLLEKLTYSTRYRYKICYDVLDNK